MSEPLPPSYPAPQHPAPKSEWKPLSGLAVTAFVLSLVLILIALPGLWIVQLVPLLLGIATLVMVKPGQRRGRILAVWAIVISLAIGSCSFTMHQGMRGVLSGTNESILSVLSSKISDEEKAKSLRSWVWPKALEQDEKLPATWMQRYAGVVAEFGPWRESFELPSIVYGSTPLLIAPEGLVEIGSDGEKPPSWTMGSTIWTPAVFEKGIVHVAIVLQEGDQKGVEALGTLRPGEETAVVGDVRFFRAKAP
ncbi:MAG: DUF4190 domain-containing protein [Planctomycetota bacterium]|nr:DUF4190 domain-containing protein [Planctomycetota bacterium]